MERELRVKGYKGSPKAIYRCLAALELFVSAPSRRSSASASEETESQPSPCWPSLRHKPAFLFFRKEEDLKAEEQESLHQLRQARPHIEVAYQLVEAFLPMVRERTGEQLDAWLGAVQASHLEAFQSDVPGVQQDKKAVLAGLTLPWSTGPVEGQVNRLKLIKREPGMVAPSSICSSVECSTTARRVWRERTRRSKHSREIIWRHRG